MDKIISNQILEKSFKVFKYETSLPSWENFIIIFAIVVLLCNKTFYGITLAVATLVLFVKVYGGNPKMDAGLTESIITLALMLLGIFLMLQAVFPASRRRK